MRIGIVDDLPRETEGLLRALALKPEHHVIWVGKSVAEAMAHCARETPDLVLIDLLAGFDGVEATRRIMAGTPCAILIVTDSVRANAERVFAAMGHGALDVVEMPAGVNGTLQDDAAPLLARIATVALLIGEKAVRRVPASGTRAELCPSALIAIGASAGGPPALVAVLRGLPRDFRGAIVIVQHVGAEFACGLADWLSEQSHVPVRVAKEGESPVVGTVLLAGTREHLVLKSANRLGYTREPRDNVHRPSVDVFFDSVSRVWPGEAVGVLLTGMGNDGAQGLKRLRSLGHHTIAQDQGTSAVYGMPKAAAALDAAVDVLPIGRIASRLVELFAVGFSIRPR